LLTLQLILLFIYHKVDPWQDHHPALPACIMDPTGDWRRRAGRPRQSWLRTVEADLRPMNLGLATAKRRAQDRSAWRLLVGTATSSTSSWRRRKSMTSMDLRVLWAFINEHNVLPNSNQKNRQRQKKTI